MLKQDLLNALCEAAGSSTVRIAQRLTLFSSLLLSVFWIMTRDETLISLIVLGISVLFLRFLTVQLLSMLIGIDQKKAEEARGKRIQAANEARKLKLAALLQATEASEEKERNQTRLEATLELRKREK